MNKIIFSEDLEQFKNRFRSHFIDELNINGGPMLKEMVYRFAMVQFMDTNGFEPGRVHFIPKILSEMQKDFGILFEEFASYCFERGADSSFVNGVVKEWIREIMSEILHTDIG